MYWWGTLAHALDRHEFIVVSAEGKTGTTAREGYGESDWLVASFLMKEARVCSRSRAPSQCGTANSYESTIALT